MSERQVKRIAVFGTESTGKTTLTERLARHFQEPWAAEFVRDFWELKNGKIVGSDLGTIALGQIAEEDLAVTKARRVAFCDTELLTNVLWADLLFPGECPPWVREEAERRCRNFSLYLLCDADIPWARDPQRAFPDDASRQKCAALWKETLDLRGLNYVTIRGDWAERERTAIAAIESMLAGVR
jgi:NadR type nicotinamide-nucleotide adenylyltransferase